MMRTFSFAAIGLAAFTTAISLIGCSQSKPSTTSASVENREATSAASPAATMPTNSSGKDEEHGHKAGAHGGIITSLGRDSYHVEAIVTSTGELRLYMLGNDESRVIDVEHQELVAYVKPIGGSDSVSIEVKPQPQPGDGSGKSSLFVGQLPEAQVGKSVDVTIPNIAIGGERFRLGFTTQALGHGGDVMPAKVADETERKLYLTAGGLYTQADIDANGNVTASQKFASFQAAHDLNPKVGDKICPVTLTKANSQCSWIIGGKTYEFCCPPCVDEFVTLAKSKPEEVKQPDQYVKRENAGSELK